MTLTSAVVVASPEDAVISVDPGPVAVTRPVGLTVATISLLLLQATAAPGSGSPRWSRTVALSCWVPPTEVKASVVVLSEISVGTLGSDEPPQAPRRSATREVQVRALRPRGQENMTPPPAWGWGLAPSWGAWLESSAKN